MSDPGGPFWGQCPGTTAVAQQPARFDPRLAIERGSLIWARSEQPRVNDAFVHERANDLIIAERNEEVTPNFIAGSELTSCEYNSLLVMRLDKDDGTVLASTEGHDRGACDAYFPTAELLVVDAPEATDALWE